MANSEDPDEMPQQSLLCLLRTKSIFTDRIHSFLEIITVLIALFKLASARGLATIYPKSEHDQEIPQSHTAD